MSKLIACCGLDCSKCDARTATRNNDDALRDKVAKLWSELNGVEITREMINCDGCNVDGLKTPFCESMCGIRKCAVGKGFVTCGECGIFETCETLSMITGNNEKALANLREWAQIGKSQEENEHEAAEIVSTMMVTGIL
ncbi:MAG: DUF3795 domain-containing protein [Anaerovoracaceae bacterium]